ncbi:AraC family transcriptional regulator [Undibacterium fentianense]|uniref:Helix-turn-helix transcriptional regulator n=1 Tax=Undibacterium fentianense TaxID=2828728 RepID=A0A941IC70_9BURK|nr:helix-turn-helix transcriptional regulator [Undibacterium fentianense]MBR7799879.1 helix-turn-helix transcriptional regulator [Undibacterium fentianense]
MCQQPITHTGSPPASLSPTSQRPVRVVARNLDADELLHTHSHDWCQVTYALDGAVQVNANHQTWFVPPLRAIWIPSHVEHQVRTLERAQLRAIYVHSSVAPIIGGNCVVLEVSDLMRELVRSLTAIELSQDPQQLQRETHLAVCLLDELAHAAPLPLNVPMPRDSRLRSLCEHLIAHPASNLSLQDFSKQVGASERTLARLFQREMQMSFGLWRQQMRLARAAPLIAAGKPMAVVASELGYASQSAFSAMFKKTFGQSPTRFFQMPSK